MSNGRKLTVLILICLLIGGLQLPTGALSEDASVILVFMIFLAFYVGNFMEEMRERLTRIEEKIKK